MRDYLQQAVPGRGAAHAQDAAHAAERGPERLHRARPAAKAAGRRRWDAAPEHVGAAAMAWPKARPQIDRGLAITKTQDQ